MTAFVFAVPFVALLVWVVLLTRIVQHQSARLTVLHASLDAHLCRPEPDLHGLIQHCVRERLGEAKTASGRERLRARLALKHEKDAS